MKPRYINAYMLMADYNGTCFIYIAIIVITILILTVYRYSFIRPNKNSNWFCMFIIIQLCVHL